MHYGFYSAYHNTTLRPGVLKAIKQAKKIYGDLTIMVTGHSMGGAMGAFCALDLKVSFKPFLMQLEASHLNSLCCYLQKLASFIDVFSFFCVQVNREAENVQVMTFGQPRIGNAAFASYYKQFLPNTIRVTHDHDIVPHLPPYYSYFPQKTYHHFPREVMK